MLAFLPFHYIIPALVFLGVILIILFVGLFVNRQPRPLKDGLRFGKEPNATYSIPENYSLLDPDSKRQITIQNLFLNHGATPENIAKLLEVEPASVVDVLKKCGHANAVNRTMHI
jgi:hypothetical protein